MTRGSPAPAARRVLLSREGIETAGLDRPLSHLIGRLPLPRWPWGPTTALLAVTAVLVCMAQRSPAGSVGVLRSAVTLLVLDQILMVVHELGHAVVLTRHGERIGRVGFGLHWAMPCFFVDSSAALILPEFRSWWAFSGVLAGGYAGQRVATGGMGLKTWAHD